MVFIPDNDGRWVNADFERLAYLVNNYDPNLELRWIPYDKRTRDDGAPYIIVDTRVEDFTKSVVLYATELDTPEQILARLYMADGNTGSVLDKLDAHNIAVEVMNTTRKADEAEELREQVKFLIGTPLHYVRFNGKKLNDSRREVLP